MRYILIISFTLLSSLGFAQDSLQLIMLSVKIGEVISEEEYREYRPFRYYTKNEFRKAMFFQSSSGQIYLRTIVGGGQIKWKWIHKEEFKKIRKQIAKIRTWNEEEDFEIPKLDYQNKPWLTARREQRATMGLVQVVVLGAFLWLMITLSQFSV